jgi:hypothetical protein
VALREQAQEAAGDREVLHEHPGLHRIGEIVVIEHREEDAEAGEEDREQPGEYPQYDAQPGDDLEDRRGKRETCRKTDLLDHLVGHGEVGKFAHPRDEEDRGEQDAPDECGD